jgi:hypothetical protein
MPRAPDGTYSLPLPPVAPGDTVSSAWANQTLSDIAASMSDSLSRTGNGGMLVPLLFADGEVGNPGITWVNEPITGFYRAGLGDMRVSILGADSFRWIQSGPEVWTGSEWSKVLVAGQGGTVPDGDEIGQSLLWNGSAWESAFTNALGVTYDPTGNLFFTATNVQDVLAQADAGLNDYTLHASDASIHYPDAPIDGTVYNRQDGAWVPSVTGVTDHGLLTGLEDDDHPQYLNEARGDARYPTSTEFDGHINDADIHFPDAPADGSAYNRQNNSWILAGGGGGQTPMVGEIRLFYGLLSNLQPGWYFCDGTNGTPDMRGRVAFGEGGAYVEGASGGTTAVTRDVTSSGAHTHTVTGTTTTAGNHAHVAGGQTSYANEGADPGGPDHRHNLTSTTVQSGTGATVAAFGNMSLQGSDHSHPFSVATTTQGNHSHTLSSGATGSSGSHVHSLTDDDPPHFVVTGYIMYTGVI